MGFYRTAKQVKLTDAEKGTGKRRYRGKEETDRGIRIRQSRNSVIHSSPSAKHKPVCLTGRQNRYTPGSDRRNNAFIIY